MVWWKNKTHWDLLKDKAYNSHQLTDEERSEVMHELEKHLTEPYNHSVQYTTLLATIGYEGSFFGIRPDCQKLVEQYLYYPENPFVSAKAFEILISDWGLISEYINLIKVFMRGVEWDFENLMRIRALGSAGDCYKELHDIECLEYLLSVFDDLHEGSSRKWTFESIARALGVEWRDIPKIDPDRYSEDQKAKKIIETARQIIADSRQISKKNGTQRQLN